MTNYALLVILLPMADASCRPTSLSTAAEIIVLKMIHSYDDDDDEGRDDPDLRQLCMRSNYAAIWIVFTVMFAPYLL